MHFRPDVWRAAAIATVTTAFVVSAGTMGRLQDRAPDDVAVVDVQRGERTVHPSRVEGARGRASEVTTAEAAPVTSAVTGTTQIALLAQQAERQAKRELARIKLERARANARFGFKLAVFNILGSNHTRPGADADHFAPGRVRTDWAVDVIRGHNLDIVGFSEIQRDQLAAFQQATGGSYDVWPGTALGGPGIPQTLAWRKSRFTAVEKTSITIPFVGQQRPQPVVRLRENTTGREFYVINAHNSPQGRQAERDAALRIEIDTIKRLRAEEKVPVFFLGDLNEKENALCKVTGQTDLAAAGPGGNVDGCHPWRGMRIDWIFGSDVTFSGYQQDRSPLVQRITDHAVVVAAATVS